MPKTKDKVSTSHLHRSSLDGLDDLETRLFLHLTEAKEEPTIFSLSILAKELDQDVESISSALDALQKKMYIRYRKIVEKRIPKIENIKDSSVRNFRHVISAVDQISILLTKIKEVPERVYKKILDELSERLKITSDKLADLRSKAIIEIERIASRISELNDSVAETNVRIAIKSIDENEGTRIINSFIEELSSLEKQRAALIEVFGLPSSEEFKESDKNTHLEVLKTRMLVGEISKEKYDEELKALVDFLTKKPTDEGDLLLKKMEALQKIREFQKEGVLQEKLADRLISELEKPISQNEQSQ